MDNDKDRYFDFSTDESDLTAFDQGWDHPFLILYVQELQKHLSYRNPILSIQGLIAMHAATSVSVQLGVRKSRRFTNSLLVVIALLLTYIAVVLS